MQRLVIDHVQNGGPANVIQYSIVNVPIRKKHNGDVELLELCRAAVSLWPIPGAPVDGNTSVVATLSFVRPGQWSPLIGLGMDIFRIGFYTPAAAGPVETVKMPIQQDFTAGGHGHIIAIPALTFCLADAFDTTNILDTFGAEVYLYCKPVTVSYQKYIALRDEQSVADYTD